VAAVDLHKSLGGHQADPEEDRHRPVANEIGEAVGEIDEGLLENVGGIDAALDTAVQPQPDHSAQPRIMTLPEGTKRAFLT
jgi:hypothetical protein